MCTCVHTSHPIVNLSLCVSCIYPSTDGCFESQAQAWELRQGNGCSVSHGCKVVPEALYPGVGTSDSCLESDAKVS